MSQTVVLQLTLQTIEKLKQHYQANLKKQAPAHTVFSAAVQGTTITAYHSGKVLFQGKNAALEAKKWEHYNLLPTDSKKTSTSKTKAPIGTLPKDFATRSIIGSDEVGNGSYFGPLIVCAAYVERKNIDVLVKMGVKDSKMLTDTKIQQLAIQIAELIPYQELVVTPEKYNQVQPTYNANHMKAVLHNQAINLLLKKIAPKQPKSILIDQFTTPKSYFRYIQNEKQQITKDLYFITKGEQYHIAVAAASILARAKFLAILQQYSQELGITIPSGAGSKSDQIAAKILEEGGLSLLKKYAKLHFANTQKAQALVKKL